jgi:hypothetical protein
MNQPASLCYRESFDWRDKSLIATDDSAEGVFDSEIFYSAEEVDVHNVDDDEDIDMADPPTDDDVPPLSDVPDESQREQLPGTGRFVETYEGCAETFPGGETFMDQFRNDQYAEQRRENIYFPWASRQEWHFASWLLRSRLSMAAIDGLLSLEIVSSVIPAYSKPYHSLD